MKCCACNEPARYKYVIIYRRDREKHVPRSYEIYYCAAHAIANEEKVSGGAWRLHRDK